MSPAVCRAAAIALSGLHGTTVMVEAAVTQQLPGMAIIGLPDVALAEAKLRVRTAASQAGLPVSDRFVTINLAPAAIPKHGSGFDLAIALATLAASNHLPPHQLAEIAHVGELGLDGSLKRPVGLLSAVIAARALGFARVMVPREGGAEARLVPGIEVIEAANLTGAVAWHRGELGDWSTAAIASEPPTEAPADCVDMAEVVGQPEATEALVIAAAGRHHLSMIGPPGAGKTLLATRLPTILPDLSPEESLTASSIASLSGAPLTQLVQRPPFESPHHTASHISIIGGGDARGIRPGAITRACHGVLFLDEAPQFSGRLLDDLRQPLESGTIEIHRAHTRARLPARVQLVLAANPCPCGNSGAPETALNCRCTPHTRVNYLQRLSGPLTDRIDLRLTVRRVSNALITQGAHDSPPSSAELRERVQLARDRAARRLTGTPWRVNADVPGAWLRGPEAQLPHCDTAVLDQALTRGALTLRGYDKTLRIAWSIADLAGKNRPERGDLARALSLRGGDFR